jgi:hypothetical protein
MGTLGRDELLVIRVVRRVLHVSNPDERELIPTVGYPSTTQSSYTPGFTSFT